MFAYPLRAAALAAAAILGLSACTTPYGHSGVSLGYGSGYGPYAGYGYGYPYGYSQLGYGYSPYWGWNDGFYYPGSGFYVYDRYRQPYRWTDAQRRYWTIRRERALASTNNVVIRDNWDDFDRAKVRTQRIKRSAAPVRVERSSRTVQPEQSTKAERATAREQRRSEVRIERANKSNGRRWGQTRED